MRGVIVDKAIYAGGVRHDIDGDISDAFDAARADGDCFLWIGLFEPDEDEFELVKDELMLHPSPPRTRCRRTSGRRWSATTTPCSSC